MDVDLCVGICHVLEFVSLGDGLLVTDVTSLWDEDSVSVWCLYVTDVTSLRDEDSVSVWCLCVTDITSYGTRVELPCDVL